MDPNKMGVRGFADKYRRYLEMFMEEVESGKHKPLTLTDVNKESLHHAEWWEFFKNWLRNL